MVQVLLIICFAILHLGDTADRTLLVQWHPAWVWLAAWLPVVVLWPAYHLLARRCVRLMETKGDAHAYVLADVAMSRLRIAATVWQIFSVTGLGWQRAVRSVMGDPVLLDELVVLAPVVTLFIGLWWSFYPLDLLVREATLRRRLYDGEPVYPPLSRAQYVGSCVRHQMLIVLLPLILMGGWDQSMTRLSASHPSTWTWWPSAEPWIQWGGMAALLITAPALLRRTWDTVRIGEGPVRTQARDICRRYRVRVAGPYLWRTHGSMVNGAILGVLYPMRYLLLTDALLDQLSARHLDGVLAHEVAHVRFRHLVWLAASVVGAVLVCGWCVSIVAYLLGLNPEGDAVGGVASGLALVTAAMVLGHVSRRFEWQADAFGARHLSVSPEGVSSSAREVPGDHAASATITPEAVWVMSGALQSVADLNGIPIARFSWRHGSIEARQVRLASLVGKPVDALPIDRHVRVIKVLAVVAIAASAIPMAWEHLHI